MSKKTEVEKEGSVAADAAAGQSAAENVPLGTGGAHSSTATGLLGAVVLYGGMILAFVFPVVFDWLGVGEARLDVVARITPSGYDTVQVVAKVPGGPTVDSLVPRAPWSVMGRVIHQGAFVDSAAVWAVARRVDGQEYAPDAERSDSTGAFRLDSIPAGFGVGDALITVRARAEVGDGEGSRVLEAETTLGAGGGVGARIDLPINVWLIVGLFSFSILIAYWPWPDTWRWQISKQVVVVALAFILTATLIYSWGVGLMLVDNLTATLPDDQSLRLGIGTIFRGTYVPDGSRDWLFSLTERATDPNSGVVMGFGAPLWGILLSVVGAGIFTVWLIVRGIHEDPRCLTAKRSKERVGEIVLHEFYIVFAPVAAILVYQGAVAAGMAAEPVTIGLVLLAAGVGLNVILSNALSRSKGLFSGDPGSGSGAGDDQNAVHEKLSPAPSAAS